MRRATSIFRGVDGLWYPTKVAGSQRLFIDHPKRGELIDRYNAMAQNLTASFFFSAPDATYSTFDAGGNPIQAPGTVVDPGQPLVISYASCADLLFAFQFIVVSDAYNAEVNGDGPGAIINADGSRSTNASKGSKSDFGGAQGLYETFLALPQVIKALKDAGRLRDAGIVQYAYDQVRLGLWTITRALLYISTNVILP